MNRLCNEWLQTPTADVLTPAYQRADHGSGIVHIGAGAFHRAHQAACTEAALAAEGGDWRIAAASLNSATSANQLLPQDCLYTLIERAPAGPSMRIIGAVSTVIQANEQPWALVNLLSAAATKIVTLTITEKGYGYDSVSGDLDMSLPGIQTDLQHPQEPTTAVGFLVAGLRARKLARRGGLTLISCDNVPGNGEMLKRVVCQFAEATDKALADWISAEVSFPSTMVDRITPATTSDDLNEVAARLGVEDHAAVTCEPFTQWVLEDSFVNGRPVWEAGGAEFVSDVAPFEKIKLRLLNGSHSCLAYCGCLADIGHIDEMMRQALYPALIQRLMDETSATLEIPHDFDLGRYCADLMNRFSNPGIKHRTAQIAMDGSKKLPQRIIESAAELLRNGSQIDILALVIAAWMRYVMTVTEEQLSDPQAGKLLTLREKHAHDHNALADALLAERSIFSADIAAHPGFREPVKQHLADLCQLGLETTLNNLLTRENNS